MYTTDRSQQSADFYRVEKAIQFIADNFKSQPRLEQIAQSMNLSKFHFNRLFKRWAGISPIQFMQYMTLDYTKQQLIASKSLLETSYEGGLSGPGRLHDLFVTFEGITPGEFKKQGAGLHISYGFSKSPFGECLVAKTQRGICYLGFVAQGKHTETLDQLFKTWPGSQFAENFAEVNAIVKHIFNTERQKHARQFNLQLKGTNFQINVWRALLNIPPGHVVSYQDIAAYIGHPSAFRAVANAVAINPVAYLIPCHRVITKTGKIHRYRWGAERKKALIAWEAARKT